MGELNDRRQDLVPVALIAETGDEASIDLDSIDRERGQVAERRVAGSEVVQGKFTPISLSSSRTTMARSSSLTNTRSVTSSVISPGSAEGDSSTEATVAAKPADMN